MSKSQKYVGKIIKKKLIDRGMTYAELADLVGASPQYVSHIICGYRSGKKYISKIKEVLDISE